MQGFDKYGVGAHTAVPTTHLQKALGFKVTASALHLALVLLAQTSCSHSNRCNYHLHCMVCILLVRVTACQSQSPWC
jgi:hypothetical protein